MAIHKQLDRYTRVTNFQCDTCHKYIEEDERNFFSKSTRDSTEVLCPTCYGRAKTFQTVTVVFSMVIASILLLGVSGILF